MRLLLPWLLALAVLLAGIALTVLTVRYRGRLRGALGLGAILLGFGQVVDPPQRHGIEAANPTKPSPENDEPPLED